MQDDPLKENSDGGVSRYDYDNGLRFLEQWLNVDCSCFVAMSVQLDLADEVPLFQVKPIDQVTVNGLDWKLLDVAGNEEADDQVVPGPSDEVLAIARWNGFLFEVISEQSQIRSFIDLVRVEDRK